MLRLESICLQIHNQLLLENESMEIYEGNVHVIMGESGSGKTTLLYEISLLANQSQAEYVWNQQCIDLLNEGLKAQIRRNRIGYILQDLELISEDLSLRDNIKCMFALRGKTYDESLITEYLNKLHLQCSLDQNVESMSRGERQRLALVLALIKDVELIICDEPTSALDRENAIELMKSLHTIAREYHKMIVIATHDTLVEEYADVLYIIENRHLVCTKNLAIVAYEKYELEDLPIHRSFYLTYRKRRQKRLQIVYKFIYALTLFVLCVGPVVFNQLLDKQNELYHLYVNNEIIVMNSSSSTPYGTYNGLLDTWKGNQIELLEEIEHVDNVEYYWELSGILSYGDDYQEVLIVPRKNIDQIVVSSFMDSLINDNAHLNGLLDKNGEAYHFDISMQDYEIKDYPKNSYVPNEIIYIPSQMMKDLMNNHQITTSSSVVVYCDDVNNVQETSQNIQKWYPHSTITTWGQEYLEQLESLKSIEKYINILRMMLVVGTIVVTYIIQTLENKSREREIGNLRINGLSQFQFYKLYWYENNGLMLVTIVSSVVGYIGVSLINRLDIDVMRIVGIFLQVILLIVITRGIPLFISIKQIFKKNVSHILRNI